MAPQRHKNVTGAKEAYNVFDVCEPRLTLAGQWLTVIQITSVSRDPGEPV